jgi:hypothetical protein
MNNNYYRKYIKYKTKYLNLQSGGAFTDAEAKDLINKLSTLIFNNTPMTHNVKSTVEGGPVRSEVTPEWAPFIILSSSREHMWSITSIKPEMEDLFKNLHNGKVIYNDRGQTLLYIALNRGHENLVKFLINRDYNINLLNKDGGSILHGIAWSDVYTFDQKINRIRDMLCSLYKYTNPVLHKNAKDETWLDNLLYRHPKELHIATIGEIIKAASSS